MAVVAAEAQAVVLEALAEVALAVAEQAAVGNILTFISFYILYLQSQIIQAL